MLFLYIYHIIGYWIYSRQKSFVIKKLFVPWIGKSWIIWRSLFHNPKKKKKEKKNQQSEPSWNHSSTDQRQSIAKVYIDPSKYFLITLTIAVVHTSPGSIHRQQPLGDASSLSPIAVIVSTDDRGIWKRGSLPVVAGNPPPQIPLVVCARFAEERRRIRAGRLIRPPTKILGRRFTRNRPLHRSPPSTAQWRERTTAVLTRFHFFHSLLFLPYSLSLSLFLPLSVSSSSSFVARGRQVGSRRLNLILNHSAAFTRYRHERERERGRRVGQRNGNFDVGSIATWINCFLATDRVDRSMKLIERIPFAANFFLELWRVRDWGILETGQFVVYDCKIIGSRIKENWYVYIL